MVTVQDQERPMITCPANTSIGTDAPLGTASFTVLAPLSVSDNSGAFYEEIAFDGTVYGIGAVLSLPPQEFPYLFVYSVRDAVPLSNGCIFQLTVVDDDPPTLTGCPDAFAVWVGSATETALIRWTPPVATDNVGLAGPATPNIPLNSRLSPPGATVVYTAVDTAGQMDTCEFMVTVSVATTGLLRYRATVIMSSIRGTSNSTDAMLMQNLADDLEDLFRTPGDPFAPVLVTLTPRTQRPLGSNTIVVELELTLMISGLSSTTEIEQAFDDHTPLNQFPTGNVVIGNTFTIGPGGCVNSDVCMNGGTCRPGRAGSHVCECTTGFTGIDCSTDIDECANSEACIDQGLSCYNSPGTFSCDCPFGQWRPGNSGRCSDGKVFRNTILILRLDTLKAQFGNDLLDPTSNRYVQLRIRIEMAVYNMLIVLPGYDFVQVRVISFSSGSIVPSLIVTVDPSSPRTQQDLQNDLTVAIANMDNSLGDGISVEPHSANVVEEVCMTDFCWNGGACSAHPTTFASTCSCPSGFIGLQCQTPTGDGGDPVTVAPPPGGLATEVIIGIAVGGSLLLAIIVLGILGVCFIMSRASSSRTGPLYDPYKYQYNDNHRKQQLQQNGEHNYTRDEMEYRMNFGQFFIPYFASGNDVAMNRLEGNPRRRGDSDYF